MKNKKLTALLLITCTMMYSQNKELKLSALKQSTSSILLVRPANFGVNIQTSETNYFQKELKGISPEQLKNIALKEFDDMAEKLKLKGVNVNVINDTQLPVKPDAVFPNNWVSFHPDGKVILYPMLTPNRLAEIRLDIIDSLKTKFAISEIIDFSKEHYNKKYLEGTGSIIFDHVNKVAYACLSPRTDKDLFVKVSDYLGYKPVYFHSYDKDHKEIYHTNVMMCIGSRFAVVCLNSITDKNEKQQLVKSLTKSGHQIIDITFEQLNNFAGNMLELKTKNNKTILAMSQSAYNSLKSSQKKDLEKYCELVPLSIKTIETIGGGSVRCMIAEIYSKSKI
ncbi:citrulline utilization hydrolase CtlX [Flavobacterium gawalongense]|nr:arginine deiminase-related protein [Flavobacterium gawalongense]